MMRLDAGLRWGPTNRAIRVTYPHGGATVVVRIPEGFATCAADVAAALHTAVHGVSSHLSCTESDGTFTFASNAAHFDLEFNPSLRLYLGCGGNPTDTALYRCTSSAVFVTRSPGRTLSHGFTFGAKLTHADHNQVALVPLATWRRWKLGLHVVAPDLARLRTVLSYALRGLPVTWYRDKTNASPFGYTNWTGKVLATLDSQTREYVESWLSSPHQTHATVELSLCETTL